MGPSSGYDSDAPLDELGHARSDGCQYQVADCDTGQDEHHRGAMSVGEGVGSRSRFEDSECHRNRTVFDAGDINVSERRNDISSRLR